MPVPDQVRDDGSGIQNILKSLDSGLRRNDALMGFQTFCETINFRKQKYCTYSIYILIQDILYIIYPVNKNFPSCFNPEPYFILNYFIILSGKCG